MYNIDAVFSFQHFRLRPAAIESHREAIRPRLRGAEKKKKRKRKVNT